jgi:hypothetical protein
MSRSYAPRRATKRWLEGAPEYVLAVFDNKGKTWDRYTVTFGGSLWAPDMGRNVFYLGMSEHPTHPQGFSQWGECSASWRPHHEQIRWLDLPEHIRNHVIARATS